MYFINTHGHANVIKNVILIFDNPQTMKQDTTENCDAILMA